VWVAYKKLKMCDPSLARAIPKRISDVYVTRYTNIDFTLLTYLLTE